MPKSKLQQHEGSSVEKNDFSGHNTQNDTSVNASLIFRIFRYLAIAGFILIIVAAIFGLPLVIPAASASPFRNNRNNCKPTQLTTDNISLPLVSLQQTEFLGAIQAEKELHSTTVFTESDFNQKLKQVAKIRNARSYITLDYDNLLEKYLNSFSFEDSEKYENLLVKKTNTLFSKNIKTENVLSFIILASDLFDLNTVSAAHQAYDLVEPKTAHGCYAKSIFYFKKAELTPSGIDDTDIDLSSIYQSIVYLKKSITMESSTDSNFLLINTFFNEILDTAIHTEVFEIHLVIEIQLELAKKIERMIEYIDNTDILNLAIESSLLKPVLARLEFWILDLEKQITNYPEIFDLKDKIKNLLDRTYEQTANLLNTKHNLIEEQKAPQQTPDRNKTNFWPIIPASFITFSVGYYLFKKTQQKQKELIKKNEAKNTHPHKKQRKILTQPVTQTAEKAEETVVTNQTTVEEKIKKLKNRISNLNKNKLKELLDIKTQITSYTTGNYKKFQLEKIQSIVDVFDKNYGNRITGIIKKTKEIETQINQLSIEIITEVTIQQFDNIVTELNQEIDELSALVTKDNSLKTLEKELEKNKVTDESFPAKQKSIVIETASSSSSTVPISAEAEAIDTHSSITQSTTQVVSVQTDSSVKTKTKIEKNKGKEKVDTKSDSTYKSLKKLKTFDDHQQEQKKNDEKKAQLLELIKLQLDLMKNAIDAFKLFKNEQTRFESSYYNKAVTELTYKSMIMASLAYGMMKSAYATVGWLQKTSRVIIDKQNYLEHLLKFRNYLMHEFDFNEANYDYIDTLSQEYFDKTTIFIHEINQKTKNLIVPPIMDLGFTKEIKTQTSDYLAEIKNLIKMHNDFCNITKPIKDKNTYDYASLVHNAERYLIALIGERFSKMARSDFIAYKKLIKNIKKYHPDFLVVHNEKLITRYEKFRIDIGHLVDGLTQTQKEFDLIFKAGVFHPLNDMLPEHLDDMSKLSIKIGEYFQDNPHHYSASTRYSSTNSSMFSSQSSNTTNSFEPSVTQSHTP